MYALNKYSILFGTTMLLQEIAYASRLNPTRANTQIIPIISKSNKIDPNVERPGVTTLHVPIVPEEREDLVGTNVPATLKCITAYTLNPIKNMDALNALKFRTPRSGEELPSFMDEIDLERVLDTTLYRMSKITDPINAPYIKNLYGGTKDVLADFAITLQGQRASECVLVPMPSSSGLIQYLTRHLQGFTKCPVANVLRKGKLLQSKYVIPLSQSDTNEYQQRTKHVDLEQSRQTLQARIAKYEQQLEELRDTVRQTNNPTTKQALAKKVVEMQDKVDKAQKSLTRQSESKYMPARSNIDNKRGYYNILSPAGDMSQLNGKTVILVDDNIQYGTTLVDAVKQLYKAGAKPANVVAFCLHRLK